MKNVLRWAGVLPAAILGSWLVYALIKISITAFTGGSTGIIYDPDATWTISGIIELICAHAALGFSFVAIGSIVAPSHKRTTAIVLAVVLAVFSGMSVMMGFALPENASFLKVVFTCVVSVIAAIVAVTKIPGEEENIELD